MSIGWTQGPLQTPLDHWQKVAVSFTMQSSWVVAVAQSSPKSGSVMQAGIGVQPGKHCDPCWA
jgi:hypothetical protein